MKNKWSSFLTGILAIVALQFAIINSKAQIIATNGNVVIINNFDTSDQVYLNQNLNQGSFPWINWFGQSYSNVVWDPSDAGAPGDTAGSGSLLIQSYYPDAGVGGCCGPQFVAYCGNSPFNPPFNGFGNTLPNVTIVTNFTCDVRFDPVSATNANGTFPTIEFGTRGVDFGQHDFGTMSVQSTNTNWVHVSIPLAQNASWTNIPNVFVKIFSGTLGTSNNPVPVFLYVDNLTFQLGIPAISPPTASIQRATPALKIFAQGGQYARTQIATADTNQSWVGGSYPVTYSFTVAATSPNAAVNEFHCFWIPLNFNSGALGEFSDYSTAGNNLRLLITQAAAGTPTFVGELDWKTNLINSNPTNIVALVTNNTGMVGTWTVTFNSASTGTLAAPGGVSAPFTIADPNIATDFANPVAFVLGMQPDPTTSIGANVDITHVQTANVASPGVPVNTDFTVGSINSNIWQTAAVSEANGIGLVPVAATNAAWWVYWSTPDIGYGLATKANLSDNNVAWKTPGFYDYLNYTSNGPTQPLTLNEGAFNWAKVTLAELPSVDGTSNGVKAAQAFFREQKPPATQ